VIALDLRRRRAPVARGRQAAAIIESRRCAPSRSRGFTLLELTIALVLLALMATVLYGALGFAGTSWDRGEAKAEASAGMRLTQEFLRGQLESQHPLRMRKMAEFPLLFGGERDELHYAASLPARVAAGGIWFYRLSVARDGERSPLVLERVVPDVNAARVPDFTEPERSILAQDIEEVRIGYYGRDANASNADEPSWRDRWDDAQRLPLLVRIDVTPKHGAPWPTLVVAPREAPEAGCRAYDPTRAVCVGV
jgi:general secretion pathway protein J